MTAADGSPRDDADAMTAHTLKMRERFHLADVPAIVGYVVILRYNGTDARRWHRDRASALEYAAWVRREGGDALAVAEREGLASLLIREEWREAPPLLVDPTGRAKVAKASAAQVRECEATYLAERGPPPIAGNADENRQAVALAIAFAQAHVVADD